MQETLLYFKDNPVNIASLLSKLQDAEKSCVNEISLVIIKKITSSDFVGWENANGLIKYLKPQLDNWIAKFFKKGKSEVLRQSGFKEIDLTAETLLSNLRIRAMLEVLALSEGTGNDYGRVVFGLVKEAKFNPEWIGKYSRPDNRDEVRITDFSKHPEVLVQLYTGQPSKDWSSACGRYQFLRKTWGELNLPNFDSHSQDIGCVKLFIKRRMIEPLLSGNFDQAVQLGCVEWASLPDAKKGGASHFGGQPSVPLPTLRAKYQEALKNFGG